MDDPEMLRAIGWIMVAVGVSISCWNVWRLVRNRKEQKKRGW
jgi:hypothetical protein